MSTISVVGVPSSAGSYAAGQDQAPAVLRSAGLITALRASGLKVQDEGDLRLQIWRPDRIRPRAQNIDQVTESIQELIERLTPHPQPAAYGPIHDQSVVQTLPDVSLDYAADHLLDAVRSVAVSKGPLHTRLQTAWVESVQHVWEKPCLTTELLARFKALWDRVTDPTAGPRSTRLRELTASETVAAVEELIALAVQTAVTASQAPPDVRLATLADLT